MEIENILRKNIEEYLLKKYSIKSINFDISRTKKEFKGQVTVVLFPIIPLIKKSPNDIANEIILFLNDKIKIVEDYNVIQGFLNIIFNDNFLVKMLNQEKKEISKKKDPFRRFHIKNL